MPISNVTRGINTQAMDNSYIVLVAVKNLANRDLPMPLGVNLRSLAKVLKCAKDDDICTLKAADEGDLLNLVYKAESECVIFPLCSLNYYLFFHVVLLIQCLKNYIDSIA